MPCASVIVTWMYLALPIAAAGLAVVRCTQVRHGDPLRNMIVTSLAGGVAGVGLVVLDLRAFGGHVPWTQFAIASYWGVAVATVLRLLLMALGWGWRRVMRFKTQSVTATIAAAMLRAALSLAIIVPYISAMLMVYRVHVVNPQTPVSELGVNYQTISFTATDGTHLSGWWIPAARTPASDAETPPGEWGKRTVIFCHGFGADKASQLGMVRDLVPNGFNVLAFDFRAHGESSGQLTTLGDLERRDVLGAVRWVRENHPLESRRIFGLGESLGAAALIGAAGDPGAEGQSIEAIALFSPFDRLTTLSQNVADKHYMPLAGWIARRLALPVAGAQLGTSLARFSPAAEIDRLAPRPLFVIATLNDQEVDFSRSQELYEQASQPKYSYWLKRGNRRAMMFDSRKASVGVRMFFEMAQPML